MSNLPLLSIQNFNISFKSGNNYFPAVQDLNINIQRGEITAIVGESGSGKSVTALSILKLLPGAPIVKTSGNILFSDDGQSAIDISQLNVDEIRKIRGNRISMIFQEPMSSLNPLMKCGQQVVEAIRIHKNITRKQAREQALDLFRKVQLPDPSGMLERYPHQLSGGQKQRVMIAMAMSCSPALLIADEPTTALDVTVQKNILQLIKDLQLQQQMSVIFITHDLGLVEDLADNVVVMYRSRIVEQGKTTEILNQPAHPYTRALMACRPALHKPGERLPMVSDFWAEAKKEDGLVSEGLPAELKTQAGNPPVLIEVKDLKLWFPSGTTFLGKPKTFVKAVDGVSFEVYKGETLGLVGESGCGKTSLGRALLQLVKPTEGEILFEGRDLTKMDRGELKQLRREIQIVFQDPYSSLNPRLSIGYAIRETLEVHQVGNNRKERTEKTVELLEKVGLTGDHFGRYPHEFSGGQRQRIGIARALALNPGFIVCDESVSALDVSVQAQVLNLLNNLKREYGFTILFISHDLGVVHYLSNRIMVMNKGKIEEIGEAGNIFNNPSREYTRKLVDAIPGRTGKPDTGKN